MKRTMIVTLLGLMLAAAAVAQTTGTQQQQQQQQPQQPSQQQPAGTQQQQPGTAQQPGAAPAAPAAPGAGHLPGTKAQPQATSQEEYNGYLAVVQSPDLAQAEAAANDFAMKFPTSQLRGALFQVLMQKYSQQNNGQKAIEMGRKSVEADPDNPVVLALLSSFIAETARETDLDFAEKSDEAVKLGQRALETVDTSFTVPATMTAEQLEGFRTQVKALAHSAMGKVLLQKQSFAEAEKHLRQAIENNKGNPVERAGDHLRLSIALDKQRRYPEALQEAKTAMTLAAPGSPAANMAKAQHDRLAKLVPGGSAGTTSTPTGAAAPGTQPTTGTTQPQTGTKPPAQTQPKPQGTTPR